MLLKIVFRFCSLNGIYHLSPTSQVDTRWWCLLKSCSTYCSTYCSSMSLDRSIDSDSTPLSQQSLPTRKLSMFYSTNTHTYWIQRFQAHPFGHDDNRWPIICSSSSYWTIHLHNMVSVEWEREIQQVNLSPSKWVYTCFRFHSPIYGKRGYIM